MKEPKAKINSDKTISKAINLAIESKETVNPDQLELHISKGNLKLGSISNLSLPPVVTCHNCHDCKKYCYAVRSYLRGSNVQKAWNDNMNFFRTNPDRYFEEITKATKLDRFFRWHVSGDIINTRYLEGMTQVAISNPKCEYLAFTKSYNVVNKAIDDGLVIPSNLHLLFSAAPNTEMPNPHNIPECHIKFEDPTLDTYHGGAEYEYHCNGNCTECAVNGCGCFFLKPGDVTIINQH